jgi:hypothetical protein
MKVDNVVVLGSGYGPHYFFLFLVRNEYNPMVNVKFVFLCFLAIQCNSLEYYMMGKY